MRKLSLWMQMSLDGFAEGPNGAFDWPTVGPEMHTYLVDELSTMGTFLYGRKVYEMMAAFWPTADADPSATEQQVAYSRLWKPMPKVVFSTTLETAAWNARIVADDIAGEVAALKEQPGGDLVLFGGPTIAASFVRLGLIDDYRLFVHPVVLGGGTALLPPLDDRLALQLVASRTFDGAVVHLHYSAR